MTSDRELLEKAAKAAGFEFNKLWFDAETGLLVWEPPTNYESRDWNPLTDDGDALRLAATRNIDIDMGLCYCETTWVDMVKSETHRFLEDWGAVQTSLDIRMKRIRRAIVRAAAEIGKDAK